MKVIGVSNRVNGATRKNGQRPGVAPNSWFAGPVKILNEPIKKVVLRKAGKYIYQFSSPNLTNQSVIAIFQPLVTEGSLSHGLYRAG